MINSNIQVSRDFELKVQEKILIFFYVVSRFVLFINLLSPLWSLNQWSVLLWKKKNCNMKGKSIIFKAFVIKWLECWLRWELINRFFTSYIVYIILISCLLVIVATTIIYIWMIRWCHSEVQESKIKFGQFKEVGYMHSPWSWCNYNEASSWFANEEVWSNYLQLSPCRLLWKRR